MGHDRTNPMVVDLMIRRCAEHGFEAFHVKHDSMGYIYNRYAQSALKAECANASRIWAAIKREALLVASESVATPQEIDEIFKSVLKTPKGPFEQMDVVGLDVVLDIEEHYAARRKNISTEPRTYLKDIISQGRLGVKNRKGFYDYDVDAPS
jgi:hypothetical protein